MTLAVYQRHFADLAAELRSNDRLRWGMWTIVGIVWLYGVLLLGDEVDRAGAAYRQAAFSLARLEAAAKQPEWTKRMEAARALRLELEQGLKSEATMGLAQASLQDWLGQASREAGVARASITVSVQEENGGGKAEPVAQAPGASPSLWRASARLTFDFEPRSLHSLLAILARSERKVAVESLSIRSTPTPRGEILVVAYFQRPPGGPVEATASQAGGR